MFKKHATYKSITILCYIFRYGLTLFWWRRWSFVERIGFWKSFLVRGYWRIEMSSTLDLSSWLSGTGYNRTDRLFWRTQTTRPWGSRLLFPIWLDIKHWVGHPPTPKTQVMTCEYWTLIFLYQVVLMIDLTFWNRVWFFLTCLTGFHALSVPMPCGNIYV